MKSILCVLVAALLCNVAMGSVYPALGATMVPVDAVPVVETAALPPDAGLSLQLFAVVAGVVTRIATTLDSADDVTRIVPLHPLKYNTTYRIAASEDDPAPVTVFTTLAAPPRAPCVFATELFTFDLDGLRETISTELGNELFVVNLCNQLEAFNAPVPPGLPAAELTTLRVAEGVCADLRGQICRYAKTGAAADGTGGTWHTEVLSAFGEPPVATHIVDEDTDAVSLSLSFDNSVVPTSRCGRRKRVVVTVACGAEMEAVSVSRLDSGCDTEIAISSAAQCMLAAPTPPLRAGESGLAGSLGRASLHFSSLVDWFLPTGQPGQTDVYMLTTPSHLRYVLAFALACFFMTCCCVFSYWGTRRGKLCHPHRKVKAHVIPDAEPGFQAKLHLDDEETTSSGEDSSDSDSSEDDTEEDLRDVYVANIKRFTPGAALKHSKFTTLHPNMRGMKRDVSLL